MKKQKNGKSEKGAENKKGLGAKTAAMNEALKDKMPSFSQAIGVLCCILVFVATKVFEKYAAAWGEWWLFGFQMVHWAALVVALGLVVTYVIMTLISLKNEKKEAESVSLAFGEVPGSFAFTKEDLAERLESRGFTKESGGFFFTKTDKGARYGFLFGTASEEVLPARAAVDLLTKFAARGFAEKQQHLLLMIEKPGVNADALRGMDLSAIAEEAGYGEWKGNLVSLAEGKDGAVEIGETVYPTLVFCDTSCQKLFWTEKSDRGGSAGDTEWNALLFTGEVESEPFIEEEGGAEEADVLRQALEKTEEESDDAVGEVGGFAFAEEESDGASAEKADGALDGDASAENANGASAEKAGGAVKSDEDEAAPEK